MAAEARTSSFLVTEVELRVLEGSYTDIGRKSRFICVTNDGRHRPHSLVFQNTTDYGSNIPIKSVFVEVYDKQDHRATDVVFGNSFGFEPVVKHYLKPSQQAMRDRY